jgi:hypothetical protein
MIVVSKGRRWVEGRLLVKVSFTGLPFLATISTPRYFETGLVASA